MRIERFEDIQAWQKAGNLAKKIYDSFRNCKDYGFKDQIQRAAVSVMNNIAEGFERQSNVEFKHFLYIAKGSCGEVRSMLYFAKEIGCLDLIVWNFCRKQKLFLKCFPILSRSYNLMNLTNFNKPYKLNYE